MIKIKKSKSLLKYFKVLQTLINFNKTRNQYLSDRRNYFGKKANFYAYDEGKLVGGIMCQPKFGWLYIDILCVYEKARGKDIGTALIKKAESYAKAKNLAGLWVKTMDFQARPFYEKCGFKVVGHIDNLPPESKMWILQKEFKNA